MLSVAFKPIMLGVITLAVAKLSVVMLTVLAPQKWGSILRGTCQKKEVGHLSV
jgi:hypothetical protein